MQYQTAAQVADLYEAVILQSRDALALLVPGAANYLAEHERLACTSGEVTGLDPMHPYLAHILTTEGASDLVHEVIHTAADVVGLALWRRHRTVYALDPTLWTQLGELSPATSLPEGIFSKLPHPDPLIVLPEPLYFPRPDGTREKIMGFYVTGRAEIDRIGGERGYVQVSTHDPRRARAVALLFGGLVVDDQDRPVVRNGVPDMLWARVTVDPAEGTIGDIAELSVSKFATGKDYDSGLPEQIPMLIRRACAVLAYLCSRKPDLESGGAPPRRAGRKGGRMVRSDRPRVTRVGFRVGATIRASVARRREEARVAVASGRKMPPHVRAAHTHMYRVGPGRSEIEFKWIDPVEINMSGPVSTTTVRPVKSEKS